MAPTATPKSRLFRLWKCEILSVDNRAAVPVDRVVPLTALNLSGLAWHFLDEGRMRVTGAKDQMRRVCSARGLRSFPILCHREGPPHADRRLPAYGYWPCSLRFVDTAFPICCAASAFRGASVVNPVLSPGPSVMIRSCVRSRLVLKRVPLWFTVAVVSFQAGVTPPLVTRSNFTSCERTLVLSIP